MKLKGNAEKFCYMIKSAIAFFVCAFVLIVNSANVEAAEFVKRCTPPSTSSQYYSSSNGYTGYSMPNCTAYVYGRLYELLGYTPNMSHNNAKTIYTNNAEKNIYSYSADAYSPQLGAIVCYTNSGAGHVQIVEEIGEDSGGRYICVSESNYSGRETGKEWKAFNYIKIYLSNLDASKSSGKVDCSYLQDSDGYSDEATNSYFYTDYFQGYVYAYNTDVGVVQNSSKFTNLYIDQLTDTSVKICAEYAWDSFNDVGFYFGTANDINQMTKVSENKYGDVTFPQSSNGNSYKLGVDYGATYGYKWWEPLTAGTKYYWAFYLQQGNTEHISAINSFTTTGDSVIPLFESVSITDLSSEGYTIEAVAVDNVGIEKVCCPTWTDANGQDDMMANWDVNAIATRVYGNTYTYRVNISEHNNERGTYVTHVYAYDMSGNTAMFEVFAKVPEPDATSPVIESATVTDISSEGYTLEIVATDNAGVSYIICPTWTELNDQDDLIDDWRANYSATHVSGNTYIYRANISDHNNERGSYVTHIYAYDASGNEADWRMVVEVPEPSLPSTLNGLVQVDGSWGYYKNGVLQTSYTGLAQSSSTGTWYYVKDGKIAWSYTGLAQSSSTGTWYYVKDGRIAWNYTGLAQSSSTGTWYYVKDGRIAWNHTGLAQSSSTGTWYYVQKGRIAWSYTGLVQSKSTGTWYYVQKGRISWNYTGIVKSGSTGNSYYVQKGRINWAYTGFVKHTDGNSYYVKKGCVDWNYGKEEDSVETWLHEMQALVGHNNEFWNTCSAVDNVGNSYKYQLYCVLGSASDEITYALDGKYKTLSGTLGLRNADNDLTKGIWIEFYGDGKLIGETVHFVAGTRPYTFEIDVTGVTDLMIKPNSPSWHEAGFLLTDGFKVSE